ncbi:amino acid adenylation domain-containing protein [Synoicihabitans lomoniglobus]|uniref:Amino acid adenylation domain-containing protein n=1 Tax=Synoicihabitans lomoniglobus TaxID=2909285 RepID=A0AAE9ZX78_9BACT|nr:amino acid adenylation domain-containing protein [Opitutaceae bacterium LMO-M01]
MPLPFATIPEAFEACVRAWPDAVAVVCDGREVSYGELNRRANRLAHHLIAHGVQPDTTVAICVERSIEMVVGQLGILKAGGVYVPLDADFPRERLEFVLADTAPTVVLTQGHLRASLPESADRAIWTLDDPAPAWADQAEGNPGVKLEGHHLAYIIYTSGSTGRAKGVALTQRGVVRLVIGQDYAPFYPGERFLAIASPSFDAIIFELWGPLLNGACCVIMPDRWPEAARLQRLIREQRVTCAFLTTGLFNQFIDHQPQLLAPLRTLLIGGEAHSPHHTRRARELLPDTVLVNGYGPTECTTFACTYRIGAPEAWGCATVPIGIPLNNTTAVIVDEAMQVVPVGQAGELCLGGLGLAREYWRRPELTAERFGGHVLPDQSQERFYRTGDLCRVLPNGNIEYLGRRDDQIKLRGFRIEPGEIEVMLRQMDGIRDAAVFVREHGETRQLAAAVVLTGDREASWVKAVRPWLLQRLPEHAVPALLEVVTRLPLTPNGKVDRRSLRTSITPGTGTPREVAASPLEAELLTLWRDVLGFETLGPQDDFFEHGGDSLMGLNLALSIEKRWGRPIPVACIHRSPTPAAMARMLSERDPAAEAASSPVGTSVFQMPGMLGPDHYQAALGAALAPEQAYWDTLYYPGWKEGERPLNRVEELAEEIIRQIRRIQPGGPYSLVGYSFGALVAFEVARRLMAAGDVVEKLVLWDPIVFQAVARETKGQVLRRMWGKFRRKYGETIAVGNWRALMKVSPLTQEQLKHPYQWLSPRKRRMESLRRCFGRDDVMFHQCMAAFETYRPREYAGDATLFKCAASPEEVVGASGLDAKIRGKLRLRPVPVEHARIARADFLDRFVELTKDALQR